MRSINLELSGPPPSPVGPPGHARLLLLLLLLLLLPPSQPAAAAMRTRNPWDGFGPPRQLKRAALSAPSRSGMQEAPKARLTKGLGGGEEPDEDSGDLHGLKGVWL